MKKILLLIVLVIITGLVANAKIRRVGYLFTPVAGTDYPTLQAAHDASIAADTVYMFPGALMNCNVTKKLVIIGPGYFLNPSDPTYPGNDGLQIFTTTTTSSAEFTLGPGSAGSEVSGCNFNGVVYINGATDNSLFRRCRFNGYDGTSGVNFLTSCNQLTFQQCVFEFPVGTATNNLNIANLLFVNCIFSQNSGYTIYHAFDFNTYVSSFSGVIQNCIFTTIPPNGNTNNLSKLAGIWLVQNCISRTGQFLGDNISYANNICTGIQIPSGNGNQQNIPWSDIFTLTGSWDGKYALKAGSPAIGAGNGGIDCGIFGGNASYRLSGIPPIPTIYSLSSPQGTTPIGNSIQINVSTRSNN